jgi:pyrroloquinoline quinone (PQQ) biosynthesis protein C
VLREKYGFSDDTLEFILLHIGADEVHSRRGIDVIKKYATTDEMQAKALKAAEEVLNLTGPAAYRRAEARAG